MALAERLCADVLGTTTDELSPATRRPARRHRRRSPPTQRRAAFTRRELREATGLGDTQLKVHLARLVDLEYVAADRAGPATSYELARADRPLRRRSAGSGGRSAG